MKLPRFFGYTEQIIEMPDRYEKGILHETTVVISKGLMKDYYKSNGQGNSNEAGMSIAETIVKELGKMIAGLTEFDAVGRNREGCFTIDSELVDQFTFDDGKKIQMETSITFYVIFNRTNPDGYIQDKYEAFQYDELVNHQTYKKFVQYIDPPQ